MSRSDELRERVRQLLTRLGRPTTEKDLLKQLRVKGDARVAARRVIGEMLAQGELARTGADRIGLPERMDLVAGRLECKARGFGFVRPVQPGWQDIYVAGPDMADAMHGDKVLVHVERRGREGRPEGRIVEVLDRVNARVVGRLQVDAGGTRVGPFDARLLYEVFIPSKELLGARTGEMVVAELTRYPSPYRAPLGRIVEVLGSEGDPGVDVAVIVAKHGLPDAFPKEIRAEAEGISLEIPAEVLEQRTDFRERVIVTIDGEDSRDFDDAVEVEILDNGNYLLGVHIADVALYVRCGTSLDDEAAERGNSVYFPERAIPMLPERLSNGICSLNPGVDRLVQSVLIEVSPDGRLIGSRFHDGVIRSSARMTYTAVAKILEDRDPETLARYDALVPHFEAMRALYGILRARREKRGSIDFDRPEAEITLDEDGSVVDIQAAERNVAHRIIEELMLLTNEVVASFLSEAEVPTIYRVHEPPDEDRVARFEDFILGFGQRLRAASEPLTPKAFQRLLERVRGTPEEKLITYVMLRAMKQAVYTPDNQGHYALAAPLYTHFTSPIRRYPDLVVHRHLRELRHSGPPSKGLASEREARLPGVAEHCSFTERRAEEAERELVDWKKVRFMADKVGDVFDGFVTGVTGFGLYVELEAYFVEGLVHIATLVDDYYHYSEEAHTLRGESTGKLYRLADPVRVQVVRVDRHHRRIDLAIEGSTGVRKPEHRPPRPASRRRK